MGTKVSDLFPSRFISTGDIGGRTILVEIVGVAVEEVQLWNEKSNRPVLKLKNVAKCLLLNRTNACALAAAFGEDVEVWSGKRIRLKTTTYEVNGQPRLGIKVEPADPPITSTGKQDPFAGVDAEKPSSPRSPAADLF